MDGSDEVKAVAAQPQWRRRRRALLLPVIDAARCTGCGRCVGACVPHVLSLAVQDWKKRAALDDAPGCTGCRLCERVCPFDAITMQAGTAV